MLHTNSGGPGREHERLKEELDNWAKSQGYRDPYSKLAADAIPDVLNGREKSFLFVGDAKDAESETPEKQETVLRISKYFKEFVKLLGPTGTWRGGILAVATNDKLAAESWTPVLNTLASNARIVSSSGAPPNFTVFQYSSNTWIIWW